MRARLRRFAISFALLALTGLCLTNSAVRILGGGRPHLLSPFFLEEKLDALGTLAAHGLTCWRRPHPEPSSALIRAAKKHGVSPALLLAVGRAESNLEPHRISHAGAMGLMQLMPETARWLGVRDPFDTEANADAAARYLRMLMLRYRGDVARIAAAYNVGPGRVPRRGPIGELPGETRHYVKRVTAGL